MTGKHFTHMHKEQKMDLMAYFYAQDSQKQFPHSKPQYPFALKTLGEYFEMTQPQNLRHFVVKSKEYQEYVAERQRPPSPPPPAEMEPLSSARIAQYVDAAAPETEQARLARADCRDEREITTASIDQVVRSPDRKGKGISTSWGLPFNDGKYLDALHVFHSKHETLDFEKNRVVVCNMQPVIDAVVTRHCDGGSVTSDKQEIFAELVKEEQEKERMKDPTNFDKLKKSANAPFRARAALGLVLLLSSVLWYVSARGCTAWLIMNVSVPLILFFLHQLLSHL